MFPVEVEHWDSKSKLDWTCFERMKVVMGQTDLLLRRRGA